METLEFKLSSRPAAPGSPTLCGVVGSGNLEVLVQADPESDACRVQVNTSAEGFRETWAAVLQAFAARLAAGATRVTINDMGATPAVVTLRLQQALSAYAGDGR